MVVWANNSNARGDIRIERGVPRAATASSQSHALKDNKHMDTALTIDYAGLVNTPIVVGGAVEHEITTPYADDAGGVGRGLVPGWLPLPNLDNVSPANYEAAFEFWETLRPGLIADAAVAQGGPQRRASGARDVLEDAGVRWPHRRRQKLSPGKAGSFRSLRERGDGALRNRAAGGLRYRVGSGVVSP